MLITAIILGLAGSLHCAGMCSPLVFAVTGITNTAWLNRLIYSAGRIFTYGILGAVVSSIGIVLPLENFQAGLSIGMGVTFLLIGLLGTAWIKIPYQKNPFYPLTARIKKQFSNFIQKKNTFSIFFLGILNGLLPCGLTLIALTSCLILPMPMDGFYFMILFGLGTLPMMLGFSSVIQFVLNKTRLSISRVNMIMLLLAGSLLIARGFTSTDEHKTQASSNEVVICP